MMVVATINRTWASFLGAILWAEYVLRWLPKGTHQWRKFPSPEELRVLLEQDGMRLVGRTGVGMNPWHRTFRLIRYEGINYMLVAVKD